MVELIWLWVVAHRQEIGLGLMGLMSLVLGVWAVRLIIQRARERQFIQDVASWVDDRSEASLGGMSLDELCEKWRGKIAPRRRSSSAMLLEEKEPIIFGVDLAPGKDRTVRVFTHYDEKEPTFTVTDNTVRVSAPMVPLLPRLHAELLGKVARKKMPLGVVPCGYIPRVIRWEDRPDRSTNIHFCVKPEKHEIHGPCIVVVNVTHEEVALEAR